VVREPDSQDDIWWADGSNGSPNFEMDDRTFKLNRERAVDYLNMLDRLYVFDGFAGWEPEVNSLPPSLPPRAGLSTRDTTAQSKTRGGGAA